MALSESDKIVTAMWSALGNNDLFTAMDTAIFADRPEYGSHRSNTVYIVRHSPRIEERIFGNTDLYSCDCVVAYFMAPEHSYDDGTGDIKKGERLLSDVLEEIQKSVIDISVPGLNISSHYIEETNQLNASDTGQSAYLAEVMTKTIYEVEK